MTARYLACEKCGAKMSRVKETRQGIVSVNGVEMGVNWRERTCTCGHVAFSIEVLEGSLPFTVQPIAGRRRFPCSGVPEAKFIECFKKSRTPTEAARKLGLCSKSVSERARRLGLMPEKLELTPEQRKDVSFMVKKGIPRKEAIRAVLQPKTKVRAA